MDLPLGTRLKDTCQKCKELTTGIVTKTRKASFTCTKCNHSWELSLTESKGKGSKFTVDALKELLERNKHVKIK
jgi:transposase-like protein